MIDFLPLVVAIISLVIVFFMLKAIVAHFANELAAVI
jgi:hypothetical protein